MSVRWSPPDCLPCPAKHVRHAVHGWWCVAANVPGAQVGTQNVLSALLCKPAPQLVDNGSATSAVVTDAVVQVRASTTATMSFIWAMMVDSLRVTTPTISVVSTVGGWLDTAAGAVIGITVAVANCVICAMLAATLACAACSAPPTNYSGLR